MSTSTVRTQLEQLPLLGETTISGVQVRRVSIKAFRLGDFAHDVDGAERVLTGQAPLRGPVQSLGKWSEVWLVVPGSRVGARVRQLRAALGWGNVRQDVVHPDRFSTGTPDRLSLLFVVPAGVQVPALSEKKGPNSVNFYRLGVEEESMGSTSSTRAA